MKTYALTNLYAVIDIAELDEDTVQRLNNQIKSQPHGVLTPYWQLVHDKTKALAALKSYRASQGLHIL